MKTTELKDLTVGELQEKIAEMTQSYARMVFNNTVSSLESPISIRHSRRDIARLKTELRKRQIQELA
jgi:large subunit ribosomal protein L29